MFSVSFQYPQLLVLTAAVLALLPWLWRHRPITVIPVLRFIQSVSRKRIGHMRLCFFFTGAAAIMASLAVCRPELHWLTSVPCPPQANIALVLDLSGSMDAVDAPPKTSPRNSFSEGAIIPSRLVSAKSHLRHFVTSFPEIRFSLIAFAETPYLIAPLSSDHHALLERLESLQTGDFPDGTAIGQALTAAATSLKCAPDGSSAIILLSDGVDHSTNCPPVQSAHNAAQHDLIIHAIGIGSSNAWHPVSSDEGIRWENIGEPLDSQQLAKIAHAGGGSFFAAEDDTRLHQAVSTIAKTLNTRKGQHRKQLERLIPMSPWLLSMAALLSLVTLFYRLGHVSSQRRNVSQTSSLTSSSRYSAPEAPARC